MRILYLGDIMAEPGRAVIASELASLREEYAPDLVIAQSENVSHGKSMSAAHMRLLQKAGVDFFTGGNHSLFRPTMHSLVDNPAEPVICPANLADVPERWGVKGIETPKGKVLVISLLGAIVPTPMATNNPLQTIDRILEGHPAEEYAAIVVNFHGDYSSEKRVIGYYLDGRVSMVVGDHWHVPTRDAMVLPKGTAHVTDVGMCGVLHSSLGVSWQAIAARWRDGAPTKNVIAKEGPYQINGLLADIDPKTHLATAVEPIQKIIPDIR